MCTTGHVCVLIDTEYSHSAMIIEFFWFFVAFLTLVIVAVKLFKLGSVHEIAEYTKGDAKAPSVPTNDPQKDRFQENNNIQNLPQSEAKKDADNINIEIDPTSQIQAQSNASSASKDSGVASPQQVEPTGNIQAVQNAFDLMVNKHLVIFIIFVYLVNNFACFIYAVIMVFLCIVQLFLFNYLRIFERIQKPQAQKYSELSYHFWILTLFISYFIHDQSYSNLP